MQKTISCLIWLLFILTISFPIATLISACFGYNFELISVTAFAATIAILSVCIFVFDLVFKNEIKTKATKILLSVITPLSLISAPFYIFKCPRIWVIESLILLAGCCCYLTIKHAKPLALKIIALILSALMVLPIGFFSLILLTFGNIGQNTVVKTVESPSGQFYAQVIDSDQGALGGDTIVDVYEKSSVNLILFKIEKKPKQVYFGDWGEYKNMQIYWKSDECLVINSVEYRIE